MNKQTETHLANLARMRQADRFYNAVSFVMFLCLGSAFCLTVWALIYNLFEL